MDGVLASGLGLAIYEEVDIVQNSTHFGYNHLPSIRIVLHVCCPILHDIKVVANESVCSSL